MSRRTISLETNGKCIENEDGVFFIGEAVNTKYVSEKELGDIQKYLVNQPIIYRHDHPAKKKGGSIYGRVVDSKIEEKEDKSKAIIFRAKMKQTLKRHRALISMAKKQEELGKPIRYSIAYEQQDGGNGTEAEVWEIAVTNNPVAKDAFNRRIEMEQKDMADEKDETVDKEVEKLQKEFEEKIGYISELEEKVDEKDSKINELEDKIKEYEDAGKEFKTVLKEYSEELKDAKGRIHELETENQMAKREPIVNKIFELEKSELMKKRYMDPNKWEIKELEDHLKEWEKKAERIKALNEAVQVQSLQDSNPYKGREQEVLEFENKIADKISPALAKLMELNK